MSNEDTNPAVSAATPAIEDYYTEERTFPPSPEFAAAAIASDRSLYEEAAADYEAFWARQAREMLSWQTDFRTTLEWNLPDARWFADGKLNASYNCLDRHVEAGLGGRVAYFWEGEPGDTRTITYADLLAETQKFANVLLSLGITAGDRVAIYMPMIPELPVAMLACARIGAAHSVIFGGFSPDAIIDRCEDAEAKVIVTADAGYRRGTPSPLKPNVDAALAQGAKSVRHVVVVDRCGTDPAMTPDRDIWWHEAMADAAADCPAEPFDAEHLLYLLYTSGTTAKPKGIMHTTGGYLTQVAFTHKVVFDIRPEQDIYWCAADIGWVTGHSYIVYGPLANACTSVMYEGTPDTPREQDRECRPSLMAERPPLGHHRPLRRDPALHRPHSHPHFHALGGARARTPRPVFPAGARHGRRTHQPRGVDVVSHAHRRRAVPHRRHLVADRNRRPHDHPSARRHHRKARFGHRTPAGDFRRGGRRKRHPCRPRRRLSHHRAPLAFYAARHLGRP